MSAPTLLDLPSVPYLPYASYPTAITNITASSSSATTGTAAAPPLLARAVRPINKIAEVVSCGSCCFDVTTAIEDSIFLTDPKYKAYQSTLRRDDFYQKVINVAGIPVAASSNVSDEALLEAALTVVKLSARQPHLLSILRSENVHFGVIGRDEKLTDNPAYDLLEKYSPNTDWDAYRGLGATRWVPISTCAEENLLCLEGDPYQVENICVHEIAHTMQGSGGKLPTDRNIDFGSIEMSLDRRLRELFENDIRSKSGRRLWVNTYAATNHEELWAEGVQSFYSINHLGPEAGDGIHNDIWNRQRLTNYHPELYDVISRVHPENVNFDCPPTSMDSCDCDSIRQFCQAAMVSNLPTLQPSADSTASPSDRPTENPTSASPTTKPTKSTPTPSESTFPPTTTPTYLTRNSTNNATAAASDEIEVVGSIATFPPQDDWLDIEMMVGRSSSSSARRVTGFLYIVVGQAILFLVDIVNIFDGL